MLIPNDLLVGYVSAMDTVSVRQSNGSPAWQASKSEALMLIAARVVEGRGSMSKLKHLWLTVPIEEAQQRAIGKAETLAAKAKTPTRLLAIDALQRMSSSRKFHYREKCEGADGKQSGLWVWQHKSSILMNMAR